MANERKEENDNDNDNWVWRVASLGSNPGRRADSRGADSRGADSSGTELPMSAAFKAMDANGDGVIDLAEWDSEHRKGIDAIKDGYARQLQHREKEGSKDGIRGGRQQDRTLLQSNTLLSNTLLRSVAQDRDVVSSQRQKGQTVGKAILARYLCGFFEMVFNYT